MAKYRITDPVYGREMIISGDAPPTQEQIKNLFDKTFSKELVFDDLVNNKKYVEDMKAAYKDREGKEFTGDVNSLLEGEFEYWNWVDNNLTATGVGIATGYFEDMDKEQKQRMLRLYDIYDRTQAFGEGSRSFWEQFKGVGQAVALDPTNWAGGYGVLTKLLTKSAAKGLGKKAIEKLLFPAGVGATWAAVAETEKQAVEKDLDKRIAYDWGKVGESAKVGATLGPAAPILAKKASQLVEGTAKAATSIAKGDALQKAKQSIVRTFGGTDIARGSVIREVSEKLGVKERDLETKGPISSVFDLFTSAKAKTERQFIDAYEKVNFERLTIDDVNKVAQELVDAGADIKSVRQVLESLADGRINPTAALRKIKQNISKEGYKSYFGKGEFKDWDADNVTRVNDIASKAWQTAARKSNNSGALKLDAKYSKWLNFKKDSALLLKKLGDDQKIITTMNQLTTNPKSSQVNFDKLMKTFSKLGKFSDDPNLVASTRKEIMDVIRGDLLSNEGKRLEKFLLDTEGTKTLKKLFPDQKDLFDDFSTIIRNAQGAGNTPLWLARFIATGLGYMSSAGKMSGAVTTGITLKSLDSALNSKGFRKLAMNAYSKGVPNEKAINGMVKWLQNNTDVTEEGLKVLRQQLLGGATIVGGITAAEDYTDVENIKKIGQAVPIVGGIIQ